MKDAKWLPVAGVVLGLSLASCGGGGDAGGSLSGLGTQSGKTAATQESEASDATAPLIAADENAGSDAPDSTPLKATALAAKVSMAPLSHKPDAFDVGDLKNSIYESVLTGNGIMGTATYRSDSGKSARVDLGRTDLYNTGESTGRYLDSLYFDGKMPLGHWEINFPSSVTSAKGNMNLEKAYSEAKFKTQNNGIYAVHARTLAQKDVVVINIQGDDGPGIDASKISWSQEKSISPRQLKTPPAGVKDNGPHKTFEQDGMKLYIQTMRGGGSYGMGYKVLRDTEKSKPRTSIIAVTYYSGSKGESTAKADLIKRLKDYSMGDFREDIAEHAKVWSRYTKKSTYVIPDAKMQAFYDAQVYKIRSAAREGGPAIDLEGPWTIRSPWPGFWHNLNTQLTYSPMYTANRLDEAQTLVDWIDRSKAQLHKNVPTEYESDSMAIGRTSGPSMKANVVLKPSMSYDQSAGDMELGNLTWMLYYYYQQYRYSMDTETGKKLFGLLKASLQYYIHLLKFNSSTKKYELAVKTHSPEYPTELKDYNTNYDVALFKWGLSTILKLNDELKMNDSTVSRWDKYRDFIDYPTDPKEGFKIAQNTRYATSHRHYSHLLMIYPLHLVSWDKSQANKDLITKSVKHWQSLREAHRGYSYSGAASMYAIMGKGDDALNELKTLNAKFIQPNTLYTEWKGAVIETPLSLMTSLQELSLQFWDGTVRVFPAIPSAWKNVSFDNFRTDGAFLISARRTNGVNSKVAIESEKGGTLNIKMNFASAPVCADASSGAAKKFSSNGSVRAIKMAKGEKIICVPG